MPSIDGVWTKPATRRCSFKAAYSTWDHAEDQAIQMSIKTGELIVTYECSECSRFHIGHANSTKPIKFGDRPDPDTVEGHRKRMAEAAETRAYSRRMKELETEDKIETCEPA